MHPLNNAAAFPQPANLIVEEYYELEIPFNQPFDCNYELNGINYDVIIQGVVPDSTGKNNFYTAEYMDGRIKSVNYKAGTGWVEIGKGQTPHSIELGSLIEVHFRQDVRLANTYEQDICKVDFEVSDLNLEVNGELRVFSVAHTAALHGVDMQEAFSYWVRNNKRYDVQAFCKYMAAVVPGLICIPNHKA